MKATLASSLADNVRALDLVLLNQKMYIFPSSPVHPRNIYLSHQHPQ